MKRYPEYKESGVEWIGEVPNHWRYSRLKFHLAENSGGIWGQDDEFGNGTFVLRSTEITIDGSWDLQRLIKRQLGEEESERFLLREDDLVITKSSGSQDHIGKTGLVDKKIESMFVCYSNFVQKLRPQSHINSKFLHYFMNCPLAREQYKYQSETTTGLANLSTKSIDELLISVPPTREQTQIANFLDYKTGQIDELIRAKERRIELLQEQRTALINQAATKGLDSNVEMKPSGVGWIGEIPKHWEVTQIKQVALFIGGYSEFGSESYTDGGIPIFRIGDVIQFIKIEQVKRVPTQQVKRLKQNQVCHGDTLIVMIGRRAGESTYYAFDYPSILSTQVAGLRATEAYSKLLFYFIHSASFLNAITPLFFGATRDNISKTALMRVKIPFPPNREQAQIVDFLDRKTGQVDELITAEQRKIELLKEYRQSLISEAVTGKIDVRNEV